MAILGIFAFEVVVFLSAVLAWPIGAFVRRLRKNTPLPDWARRLAWLVAAQGA